MYAMMQQMGTVHPRKIRTKCRSTFLWRPGTQHTHQVLYSIKQVASKKWILGYWEASSLSLHALKTPAYPSGTGVTTTYWLICLFFTHLPQIVLIRSIVSSCSRSYWSRTVTSRLTQLFTTAHVHLGDFWFSWFILQAYRCCNGHSAWRVLTPSQHGDGNLEAKM